MKMSKDIMNTRSITVMGILMAMEIILSLFCSISAWNIKIGFSFVPIAIGAVLLGPVEAGIIGALSDFIGAIVFPMGLYFPGFTITAFFVGLVYGIALHKKQTYIRIGAAVIINQFVFSQIINTFWISVLYGTSYVPLFITRIWQTVILVPVQLIVSATLLRLVSCKAVTTIN